MVLAVTIVNEPTPVMVRRANKHHVYGIPIVNGELFGGFPSDI